MMTRAFTRRGPAPMEDSHDPYVDGAENQGVKE